MFFQSAMLASFDLIGRGFTCTEGAGTGSCFIASVAEGVERARAPLSCFREYRGDYA
jgi:hypothetical protein